MNLELLKKANTIYSTLVHLTEEQAIKSLDNIEDLDQEVYQIVKSLITSGEQSSAYFKEQVGAHYDLSNLQLKQWKTGDVIGNYQLIKKIGEGGMSKVFSAKRINTDVQKLVAIKIFSPHNYSAELRRRFVAEQEILSGLTHPNIITMQHGDTTKSGEAYIVMDLIEQAVGINEYTKENKLSIHQKIQLILEVAKALSYAHSNLIIHRDIKPSNLIVTTDGVVKIVDFGIAKQISNTDTEETTIMALTPSFAAPEQINAGAINVATDIFSLAAVCVAILTGKVPLPADRVLKSCQDDEQFINEIIRSHSIDKDLINILNQALKLNPKERYNSMDRFAEDLQAWLNNEPVSATPDSLLYRLSKFAKRRKALFASLMTLMISMTIALIALSWQYNKTKIEAQKAQQVKQFMLDAFSVTDPNVSQGAEISAKDLLKLAAIKLDENTLIEQETKFDLYQTIGIAYGQLGFFKMAINYLNDSLMIKPQNSRSLTLKSEYLLNIDQLEDLDKLLQKLDKMTIRSITDKNRVIRVKVRLQAKNGNIKAASNLFENLSREMNQNEDSIENIRLKAELAYISGNAREAIDILNHHINNIDLRPNHTLLMELKNDLIKYYNDTGQYELALETNRKIIAQQKEILGNRHPDLGYSLLQLSRTYRLMGDLLNAQKAAIDSNQLFTNLYGENSMGFAQSLSKLAMLDYLNGHVKKATEEFEKSVKIYTLIYSDEHLETLKAKVSLAGIYTATGKYEQAESLLQIVFQIQKKKLGESHKSTLNTQQHLIRSLLAQHKFDQAIVQAEKNYKLANIHYNEKDPIVDGAQFILSTTYFKSKKYQKALNIYLHRAQVYTNKTNHIYANLMWDIAKTYEALDKPDQAELYYLQSIKAYEKAYSATHIRYLRIQLVYASFLQSQKRMNEAQKITAKVMKIYHNENIEEPRLLKMVDKLNAQFIQNH